MISRLEQNLRKHTDNDALVSALVAFPDRALDDWNNARAVRKALKKASAAFKELADVGYTGLPVNVFREEIEKHIIIAENLPKAKKFRRYIVFEVAWQMREAGVTPSSTNGGLLEKLGV